MWFYERYKREGNKKDKPRTEITDFGIFMQGDTIHSDIHPAFTQGRSNETMNTHSKYKKGFAIHFFSHQPFSMSSLVSSTIGLLGIHPYYKLAALFFSVMLYRKSKKDRDGNPNSLPLPPGPKGYPLIGNLFDMPSQSSWVVYDEWRKTYGKSFTFSGLTGLSPKITGLFR